MSDKADGSDLIEDKTFQKLLAQMDDDADKAEKSWKSQVNDRSFTDFPSDFLAQYKKDGLQLSKTRGAFNGEWNKVVFRRGDPKKLLAAYDAYSGDLELLRESNARFKALIDVKVAARAAAWLVVIKAFALLQQAYLAKLSRELEELKAELKKAEDEVSDAKLKRALNVALSVVTLVIEPEAVLLKVALAAGGISGHLLIDYTLGHVTLKGAAADVGGDSPEVIENVSEAGKKQIEKLGKAGKKLVGVSSNLEGSRSTRA